MKKLFFVLAMVLMVAGPLNAGDIVLYHRGELGRSYEDPKTGDDWMNETYSVLSWKAKYYSVSGRYRDREKYEATDFFTDLHLGKMFTSNKWLKGIGFRYQYEHSDPTTKNAQTRTESRYYFTYRVTFWSSGKGGKLKWLK